VPYKFGCFSFQANQDLLTLGKYGLVNSETKSKSSNWILADDSTFYSELKKEDQSSIQRVKTEVEKFSQKELVKYTYLNYPFYATKSQIAKDILSDGELASINQQRRNIEDQEFFTIGYEGISLETYLNKLIINDVKLLCDVRKNSLSMKYGFSKSQLKNACESIGIKYMHIPELGIESDKRKKLVKMSDYNELFEEYEKTTLKDNHDSIKELFQLVKKHSRVAITCFEKEVCMCHRGRVLNSLTSLPEWSIPYKNL
jgi:uncharacterized protein (DUF488 family)